MTRLGTATLAAVLLGGAWAVPPAHAAADSTWDGQCFVNTVSQDPDPDHMRWIGVLGARVLVYSAATPADNPVSARVTCRVLVNGVTVRQASFDGTVLVAGAGPLDFTAQANDLVQLCTDIDYTSNATPTEVCAYRDGNQIPPPLVWDAMEGALRPANDTVATYVDPVVCPLLAARAPGVPGVVDIDPTGDTSVAGGLVWDCPPYLPPGS
jgi:hypothetical protein